jgi:hypothetical protein
MPAKKKFTIDQVDTAVEAAQRIKLGEISLFESVWADRRGSEIRIYFETPDTIFKIVVPAAAEKKETKPKDEPLGQIPHINSDDQPMPVPIEQRPTMRLSSIA